MTAPWHEFCMTSSALRKSLGAVAAVEAAKGAIVLLVGFGLLGMLHEDLHALGTRLVAHLHLNPAKKYPRVFLDALDSLNDQRLWMMAGLALLYSSIRFAEAYGLWRGRTWAEWLALIGASIYLPFEVYEIGSTHSWLAMAAFAFNLLVVWLAGRALWLKHRSANLRGR